ncbi:heat shock factor binding protein 1 protein [Besnoitia besnoiti]|uniref:Heat shock factor binding protein 1 protein n=1 Tax=Besnoitia besnoiti TaxID=94643 RepID=A0A2A9M6F5_BESBE|nr:heat shock factor binding protein 1 protein [Besnoitia besnoiti]PFH34058.1 heat shock factor binding protein 1 protein [Besnoitia besnoiti]
MPVFSDPQTSISPAPSAASAPSTASSGPAVSPAVESFPSALSSVVSPSAASDPHSAAPGRTEQTSKESLHSFFAYRPSLLASSLAIAPSPSASLPHPASVLSSPLASPLSVSATRTVSPLASSLAAASPLSPSSPFSSPAFAAQQDCWQCRFLGVSLFSGVCAAALVRAVKSPPASGDRRFFSVAAAVFAFLGSPSVPAALKPALPAGSLGPTFAAPAAAARAPFLAGKAFAEPPAGGSLAAGSSLSSSSMGSSGFSSASLAASLAAPPTAAPPGSLQPQVGAACDVCDAVQGILREMDEKFSSMTESILNRLDDMSGKIDGLEQQLQAALISEEADYAAAIEARDPRTGTGQ